MERFSDDSDLPEGFIGADIKPVKFFTELSDVILDTSAVNMDKTDYDHILDEKHLKERFPIEIQNLYQGRTHDLRRRLKEEIELSLKRTRRDYKFAIPQIYFGEIGFLLPIYFDEQADKTTPGIVLVMTKHQKIGSGTGVLLCHKNMSNTANGVWKCKDCCKAIK